MITFLLCAENALSQPLLYLSLYFKEHRDEYYALLQQVRTEGVWEEWLRFFLRGVDEVGRGAEAKAIALLDMFKADRKAIEDKLTPRKASSALRVHERMQRSPISKIPELSAATGMSKPTVSDAIESLREIGLVAQAGAQDRKRDRSFYYIGHLKLLVEDTQPLAK